MGHIFAGFRAQNQSVTMLPSCNQAVQKNNKNLFVSQTIDLLPGGALVICSPGVLERASIEGKAFGTESIVNILNNNSDLGALELRQKDSVSRK